ncbi:hypothetical protein DFH06DRAFT_1246230 [Mycena polygramma]|nr:hypothetical protein DFH06DRAFT_1246230 [Mycena polygramma]
MLNAGQKAGTTAIEMPTTVHPECQIVAWVVSNRSALPYMQLIPYVTCSKLHCLACGLWLDCYNVLSPPHLPKIFHDGSHSKLHPGWSPPALGAQYKKILELMTTKIDQRFAKTFHGEGGSLSTLPSHPIGTNKVKPRDLELFEQIKADHDRLFNEYAKRVRPLHKKLRAIDELKMKQQSGKVLEKEQLEKIDRESQIRAQIDAELGALYD